MYVFANRMAGTMHEVLAEALLADVAAGGIVNFKSANLLVRGDGFAYAIAASRASRTIAKTLCISDVGCPPHTPVQVMS
jgi:hypothetical protein